MFYFAILAPPDPVGFEINFPEKYYLNEEVTVEIAMACNPPPFSMLWTLPGIAEPVPAGNASYLPLDPNARNIDTSDPIRTGRYTTQVVREEVRYQCQNLWKICKNTFCREIFSEPN